MTAISNHAEAARPVLPGPLEQVTQLAAVLALVEEMAGESTRSPAPLADPRVLQTAYDAAPGIAQLRFEAIIGQGAELASTGVRALLDRQAGPAALCHLADALRAILDRAAALLGL